ncbi:MAG: ATP-binding protein [Oscillospiraceae bacterium]|nr:ATP-binding protein [Oscillospiraceae bacterium]
MGYSRDVYEQAMQTLERRRNKSAAAVAALAERMAAAAPEALELRDRLSRTGLWIARALMESGDPASAVERLREENLELQKQLARLLAAHGEKTTGFEPEPYCPLCGDTGYHDRKMCDCLSALLREYACSRVSRIGEVGQVSFDDFSLEYYSAGLKKDNTAPGKDGISPREQMRNILAYCKGYAEEFAVDSVSLLLRGPTGVGKTHLSLAIAQSAAGGGFSVVYGSAQQLLRQAEREYFGRAEDTDSEEWMCRCDLLVIDDLGAEFASAFATSALYNLINTRMMSRLPTIISTNLSQKQMIERYGEQITSRITGFYEPLLFAGRDIRQIKAKEQFEA